MLRTLLASQLVRLALWFKGRIIVHVIRDLTLLFGTYGLKNEVLSMCCALVSRRSAFFLGSLRSTTMLEHADLLKWFQILLHYLKVVIKHDSFSSLLLKHEMNRIM